MEAAAFANTVAALSRSDHESSTRRRRRRSEMGAVAAEQCLPEETSNASSSFFQPKDPSPNAPLLDGELAAEQLHDCARARDIARGKRLHSLLAASGQDQGVHLGNLLVTMYGKCRSVENARLSFDRITQRNRRSWNVMISAYAQNGHLEEAVGMFKAMYQEGVQPDNFTFSTALSAYTRLADVVEGRKVHERVASAGFLSDLIVATGLVNLYGKCGSLDEARQAFESALAASEEDQREGLSGSDVSGSVGLWTAMVAACIDAGEGWEAIRVFAAMLLHGVRPNSQTLSTVLNACSAVGALKEGRRLHDCVIRSLGMDTSDTIVATSLVTMYAKCKSLDEARAAFDRLTARDIISWNAMLAAYTHNGQGHGEAFTLFQAMQLEGIKPDKFTMSTIVVGLATLAQVDYVKRLLAESSLLEEDLFLANTLVTMYGKHGCVGGARSLFDAMKNRDVISWTALIGAYAQNGMFREALHHYHAMNLDGFRPNQITFVSALDACLNLGALQQGRAVHAAIATSGVELDCFLETALVNMYGKCGSLETARAVFNRMPATDIVTWTSIIGSHAQHGKGSRAMDLFHRMELEGHTPNAVTFIIFISSCSHAGLVDEALAYFGSMTSDYSILPDAEHCLCIIDLLARSGRLADAERFIERMPFKADAVAWTTLLAACKATGETFLGAKAAAKDLFAGRESGECGPYVMLANSYTQTSKDTQTLSID
ncbi:pentatricopeptide repeat-containing protein At4g33990 [Selaginella moellendorffii]|uniref:pentatricopeptide repeat-containing protein At4g33990 n=1 Tax=Selaginella moellendorffii TaxID=88036 RepID=UPI000D1CA22A|nr:pentatricopeptide repeat-containing protein At4g33990 [Selaginella moellendorffii]|eukprot:XP_024536775.1 pentatricopeptide repeat-containing protein At4g33990 [Selaginella moellendorffii]